MWKLVCLFVRHKHDQHDLFIAETNFKSQESAAFHPGKINDSDGIYE